MSDQDTIVDSYHINNYLFIFIIHIQRQYKYFHMLSLILFKYKNFYQLTLKQLIC